MQTEAIRKHLALVFKHEIDPSMGPAGHQAELDAIHVGDQKPTGASTEQAWGPSPASVSARGATSIGRLSSAITDPYERLRAAGAERVADARR